MATASVTKAGAFKRCKRKFYYMYKLRLRRKRERITPARGKLIHACLQNLYSGKDPMEPINSISVDRDKVFDEEYAEWTGLQGDVSRILRGYLNAYRDTDKLIKTVATEYKFSVDIGKHTFIGVIDWIFEDAMGLWVADHKVVGGVPEVINFSDVQTSLYYRVAEIYGYNPVGVVFNYLKKRPPAIPKLNKDGSVSRAMLDTDIATYMTAVKNAGLNPEDYEDMREKLEGKLFYRRIRMPRPQPLVDALLVDMYVTMDEMDAWQDLEDERYFSRTFLANRCDWDCEFQPLCIAELCKQDTTYVLEDFEVYENPEESEVSADAE